MLYSVANLRKSYGGKTILNIPQLEIEAGKIYGLLGPNGAGKTTLLNILGFLSVPDSGEISFNSQKVRYSASQLHKLRNSVVLVHQKPVLFTTSVYRNIEFGLKLRKIPRKERKKIISEVLELTGLSDCSTKPANRLSGGESQRVAIARAIALSPSVLLCDEPTSNIDTENRTIIVNILKQINRESGVSIIFTSHDTLQGASLSHEKIFMSDGSIEKSSELNIFPVKINQGQGTDLIASYENVFSLRVSEKKQAGNSRIVIDPEDIKVHKEGCASGSDNTICCRIIQITQEHEKIRLYLDAGVFITALIPADEYTDKLKLLVGDMVTIEIPPATIKFC